MNWRVDHGECLEVLRQAAPESVDSVVTDPPAGIDFMGRDWDCFRRRHNPADVGRDDLFGRTSAAAPHSYGESDRGNFIAFMTEVMQECLRVLKPGGHALVWALPRTSHWTATAIEDAGFEIRTVLHHHFGSGFPKSLDVGKAIDKQAGAAREVIGRRHEGSGWKAQDKRNLELGFRPNAYLQDRTEVTYTAPATEDAKAWDGWGTAIKPATEHWILARKPLGEKNVAANVLKHGTGALNIGASRVGRAADDVPGWHKSGSYGREGGYCPTTCRICDGTTHALCFSDGVRMDKPGEGPCWNCGGVGTVASSTFKIRDMPPEEVQARCGDKGRWPPDLLLSHGEGCERVGTQRVKAGVWGGQQLTPPGAGNTLGGGWTGTPSADPGVADASGQETVDLWECVPGCPVAELDRQSGGGSRFFPVFRRSEEVDCIASSLHNDSEEGGASVCLDETVRGDIGESQTVVGTASGENPVVERYTSSLNIAGSGSETTGRSQRDMKSTIEITTPPTTESRILNLSLPSGMITTINDCERIIASAGSARSVSADGVVSGNSSPTIPFGDQGRTTDTASLAPSPVSVSGKQETARHSTRSAGKCEDRDETGSRFFPTFHYIPKPSRREREAGLEKEPNRTLNRVNPGGIEDDPRWAPVQVKNHHPTVKSKALMDWLIRLITPPAGLVLDPFTGSGSTGVAAVAGGFSFWGIEQNEEYHRIAEKRIAFARAERSGQLSLFDEEE